jgi:dienelactone hydrolase
MSGWGYVTLAVDDFTTRGVMQTCTQSSFIETIQDALGALRFLAEQSFVDPKRLAVVGFAQGGTTALSLALNRLPPLDDARVPPLPKAVVSFYPWCADARGRLATATLILAGERDDWNPAVYCEQWVQRHANDGAELKFAAHANAHHAFDNAEMGSGRNVFGHWLQYDADAAAQAMAETRAFLAKHLGGN